MTKIELDIERKRMGQEVRVRRKYLGLTLEDLSMMTGLRVSTILRFEDGRYWMPMPDYLILLYCLGMERPEPTWKNI